MFRGLLSSRKFYNELLLKQKRKKNEQKLYQNSLHCFWHLFWWNLTYECPFSLKSSFLFYFCNQFFMSFSLYHSFRSLHCRKSETWWENIKKLRTFFILWLGGWFQVTFMLHRQRIIHFSWHSEWYMKLINREIKD